MKSCLLIFFIAFCLSNLSAQENHFVFIQSDNHQPFYVSLNGKLYSSTSGGYLIIPKLASGNYSLFVGFAKNASLEESFQSTIENKDLGFGLKDYGEKGWGLVNLQTLSVTMGESGKTDIISKALSQKNVVREDVDPIISFDRKKKTTTSEEASTGVGDTTASQSTVQIDKTDQEVKDELKQAESKKSENKEDADGNVAGDVRKVSEANAEDGVHLAYVEGDSKTGDTISIVVPSDKSIPDDEKNTSVSSDTNKVETPSTDVAHQDAAATKDSLKFLNINSDQLKKELADTPSTTTNNLRVITNSKCKDIATDDDYMKLRRKMAGETTDEKMINVARKVYKNKCFATRQIKSLSTLFLSDEGRFNFFNASYNSVSDVAQYSTLQSEFIDPAFTDRFKAILK